MTMAFGAASTAIRNISVLRWRSTISCCSAWFAVSRAFLCSNDVAELIMVTTLGTRGGSKNAVVTETAAVTNFTAPESQYTGVHSVQIYMKCVPPHAMMNAPNATNIHENGISCLARRTR